MFVHKVHLSAPSVVHSGLIAWCLLRNIAAVELISV